MGDSRQGDEPGSDETQPMPQVGRDPETHDAIERSGVQGAWLMVVAGSGRVGERFRVLATTTVGRSPDSDVFLDDVTVSREHAVIFNDSAGVRVEDKSSLNGTFVNGERVERSELVDGDTLQIGKYRVTYVEEGA